MIKDRISQSAVAAAIGAAALVVGSLGVGVSIAAATSHNTIHTCYAKHGGALRFVKRAGACHDNEKSLAFNQRGRRGARGLRGPAGPVNLIWADVDSSGSLAKGSHATSASYDGAHQWYVVNFDRTVSACHYWVQPGYAAADYSVPEKFTLATAGTVAVTASTSSSSVVVRVEQGGTPTFTRFMLFVLC